MSDKPLSIKAVLFDFDGTLTKPGALDFEAIRQAIGCPSGRPILEFIASLPDPAARQTALATLDRLETEAARCSEPNDGAEEIISYLRGKRIPAAIVSRNSRASIEAALRNFTRIQPDDFAVIVSRDDTALPKPNAEGILLAAQQLGMRPDEVLVVGDYVFDIEAGINAGSPTVLLNNRGITLPAGIASDYTISELAQLRDIIALGTPLPQGKLPNRLLRDFLADIAPADPSVLVRPDIGEDTAAVDVSREDVIVLKSDPITFVTDSIGCYAVLVNANDIATTGACSRWFLTTLLFPPGTTPDAVRKQMRELSATCARWGISLCGGHTEITDAVVRPVVTGMLVGTVARKNLLEKRAVRPGDRIVMTKTAGIEGTAILARECPDRLAAAGVSEHEIEACAGMLEKISVLEEARIAARIEGVRAMHDVTEGGIATAIEELSAAAGCGIRIFMERIAVHPLTRRVCDGFGINPFGLIGSGCLLICCADSAINTLCTRLKDARITYNVIAEVLEHGKGIEAVSDGAPASWPHFEVDELARFFQGGEE